MLPYQSLRNERENFKSDCKNMEVWKLNELERQEKMKRKMNIILMVFLTTLMALGILTGCSRDSGGSADKLKKDYSNIVENPNISIPGYESLDFKAGKTKQSVDFYNPESNKDEFLMTFELLLASADGSYESVYSSGLVEAGNHITSITLVRPLTRGTYENCVLRVQPYFVADRNPANTAEVVFTLYAE